MDTVYLLKVKTDIFSYYFYSENKFINVISLKNFGKLFIGQVLISFCNYILWETFLKYEEKYLRSLYSFVRYRFSCY